MIHKFVTQVARSEMGEKSRMILEHKLHHNESALNNNGSKMCYYVEGMVESLSKSYLVAYKEHLNQSLQTMKFLQNVRKPLLKEIDRQSITLPQSKCIY